MKKNTFAVILLCGLTVSGQSHCPGQHSGKFSIVDKLVSVVNSFDLQDVRLLDRQFKQNKQNKQREKGWLLSLDVNRLLHSFRTNAGIYSGLEGGYDLGHKPYGLESLDCEFRGHSTAHIFSALVLLPASTGGPVFKAKADSLISALAKVQQTLNEGGYLSAFPEELINRNIEGKRVWAPGYTLHRILSGLIDQYLYCDNRLALNVAARMGSWAYSKLQSVSAQQRNLFLQNEFGDINEAFYYLYSIKVNQQYKWLGGFVYDNETVYPLKQGKAVLAGRHANTNIPKLLGLARLFEIDGKGLGDSIATFFLNTVIDHHSFVTGSNSDTESFFKADNLSKHLTCYSGESCNVYNLLKLTRHLSTHTGNLEYAEYYEKSRFNHILGQQNPGAGMITYFLPMLTRAHKLCSTRDSSFWSCVGIGIENNAKFGESIYYHSSQSLFINLLVSSELNGREKELVVRPETDFPNVSRMTLAIYTAPAYPVDICIRYPFWPKNGALIKVNRRPIKLNQQAGTCIPLSRRWNKGDAEYFYFPMSLQLASANDDPGIAAIVFGTIGLASLSGKEGMESRAPYSVPFRHNDYYSYDYDFPQSISPTLQLERAKLDNSIAREFGGSLLFRSPDGSALRPLHDIHGQRNIVYWKLKQGNLYGYGKAAI